jgi:hypothetical protein
VSSDALDADIATSVQPGTSLMVKQAALFEQLTRESLK